MPDQQPTPADGDGQNPPITETAQPANIILPPGDIADMFVGMLIGVILANEYAGAGLRVVAKIVEAAESAERLSGKPISAQVLSRIFTNAMGQTGARAVDQHMSALVTQCA